jgi:hypothetical protein
MSTDVRWIGFTLCARDNDTLKIPTWWIGLEGRCIVFVYYGKLQCYLSQSCSARKIIGNKHLFENSLYADLSIYHVSKYLCVDMTICDSQKYFMFI